MISALKIPWQIYKNNLITFQLICRNTASCVSIIFFFKSVALRFNFGCKINSESLKLCQRVKYNRSPSLVTRRSCGARRSPSRGRLGRRQHHHGLQCRGAQVLCAHHAAFHHLCFYHLQIKFNIKPCNKRSATSPHGLGAQQLERVQKKLSKQVPREVKQEIKLYISKFSFKIQCSSFKQ